MPIIRKKRQMQMNYFDGPRFEALKPILEGYRSSMLPFPTLPYSLRSLPMEGLPPLPDLPLPSFMTETSELFPALSRSPFSALQSRTRNGIFSPFSGSPFDGLFNETNILGSIERSLVGIGSSKEDEEILLKMAMVEMQEAMLRVNITTTLMRGIFD